MQELLFHQLQERALANFAPPAIFHKYCICNTLKSFWHQYFWSMILHSLFVSRTSIAQNSTNKLYATLLLNKNCAKLLQYLKNYWLTLCIRWSSIQWCIIISWFTYGRFRTKDANRYKVNTFPSSFPFLKVPYTCLCRTSQNSKRYQ